MKKLSLILLTLCFGTMLFAQQKKITTSMKKQYIGQIMPALGFPDFPIGTYQLQNMYGRGDGTAVGLLENYGLRTSKKIDLSKFLGKIVVVTAKKVTVKKSGVIILEIETIKETSEQPYADILQLKNTNWNLKSVAVVNSNGDLISLSIQSNSATLRFKNTILGYTTFIANFCHDIKGDYVYQGKLLFENVIKKGENQCTSTEKSPIGTKPNISSAENILNENKFDIKIEKNKLILSNSKGDLYFEKSPF